MVNKMNPFMCFRNMIFELKSVSGGKYTKNIFPTDSSLETNFSDMIREFKTSLLFFVHSGTPRTSFVSHKFQYRRTQMRIFGCFFVVCLTIVSLPRRITTFANSDFIENARIFVEHSSTIFGKFVL